MGHARDIEESEGDLWVHHTGAMTAVNVWRDSTTYDFAWIIHPGVCTNASKLGASRGMVGRTKWGTGILIGTVWDTRSEERRIPDSAN